MINNRSRSRSIAVLTGVGAGAEATLKKIGAGAEPEFDFFFLTDFPHFLVQMCFANLLKLHCYQESKQESEFNIFKAIGVGAE